MYKKSRKYFYFLALTTTQIFISLALPTYLVKETHAQTCEQAFNGCCGMAAGCNSNDLYCHYAYGVYACTAIPQGYDCNDPTRTNCQTIGGGSDPIYCSTPPECGPLGGCADGKRCVNQGYAKICITDTTCPQYTVYPGSCSYAGLGECGPDGGCNYGDMCRFSDSDGDGDFEYWCQENDGCEPAPAFEGERSANPFSISGIMSLFRETDANEAANFFEILYRIILPVVIVIGMIMVVLAGYGIMFSTGDPTKTTISKEKLTSAITGLIFTIFGAGILRAIIKSIIIGN